MTRYRRTLTLILICLPVLATVISAFRLRDLPRSAHDSETKESCDNCDVNGAHKLHSVRIESDKRSHEDYSKEINTKQQSPIKKPENLSPHKFEVKSDEDDEDDDDLDIFKEKSTVRKDEPKVGASSKKKVDNVKTWSFFGDDEEDSDDDEDDDDDDEIAHTGFRNTNKILNENKKTQSTVSKKSIASESHEKLKTRETDSLSDEDDDVKITKPLITKPKIVEVESKPKIVVAKKSDHVKLKPLNKNIQIDDDDDEIKNDEIHIKRNQNQDVKIKDKTKFKATFEISESKETEFEKDNTFPSTKENVIKSNSLRTKNQKEAILEPIKPIITIVNQHFDKKINKTDNDRSPSTRVDGVKKLTTPDTKSKQPIQPDSKAEPKQTQIKAFEHKAKPVKSDRETFSKKESDVNRGKEIASKIKGTESTESHAERNKQSREKEQEKTPVSSEDSQEEESSIFWFSLPSYFMSTDGETESSANTGSKPLEVESKSQKKSTSSESMKTSEYQSSSNTKQKRENKDSERYKEPPLRKEVVKDTDKDKFMHKSSVEKTFTDSKETKKSFESKLDSNLKDDGKKTQFDLGKRYPNKEDTKTDKTATEKLVVQESGADSNLKHIDDALHRRNMLKSEFEDFYSFFPTFAPNFSRIPNPECRRHGQIVLRQLRGTKLWALNMLDATAKVPSGILQGNGIQLGDFDQCLSSRARVQLDTGSVVKVQGKYCLAHIDVKAEHPELEAPVHLAQAKNLIRSRVDDPGHFVPRFSTLSWGVCVPTACNPEDVELIIRDAIKHYQKTSGFAVRVKVEELDCHAEKGPDWWQEWLEWPTLISLSFFALVILLVLITTVQDFLARRSNEEITENSSDEAQHDNKEIKNGSIRAFSLYHTINKLTAPGTSDEIPCIHGVRALATIALLIAHKFLPVASMPYTNRLKITDTVTSPIWSWCRAGWVFTDCFLLLSGTLTAHRMSTDKETGSAKRLLYRYLRLTPALLAVVLFYAYVWDNLSAGPMWGTYVTKNAEICQQGWWWNILYVQNYFGLEEMCAPQTHQLALDMQLTILGGVVVWASQAKRGLAHIMFPVLHALAAYSRFTTVRDHRLTMLAYHGVSVSQLYRTARLSYTSTLHRSTPYLVGLSLGSALSKPAKHGKILLTLGWLTSSFLWGLVWWAGSDAGSLTYKYRVTFAAQYATMAPLASAMAIAWVIYAVHNGCWDVLTKFLCSRPLVLISRLSYAIYLCQFIIFITNVGTVKTSNEFSLMSLVDVQEISAILLTSIVLTLTIVIPMQTVHKILPSFSFEIKERKQSDAAEPKKHIKFENDVKNHKEEKERFHARSKPQLLAHREMMDEIPEMNVKYEPLRPKHEGLDEILEEEENEMGEESQNFDEDLEILEEEQGGEEDWDDRDYGQRPYSREGHDLDDWEWTANSRDGAQYRHMR